MQKVLFIILISSQFSWSQETFKSSHTIYQPSELVEEIYRTITISKDQEYILIKTFLEDKITDDQLLVIKNINEKEGSDGNYLIYQCVSRMKSIQLLSISKSKIHNLSKLYNLR